MITSSNQPESESEEYIFISRSEKMDDLLTNPRFVLLGVPKGGGIMKLVRPATDPEIQRELKGQGVLNYYALSHLWGMNIPNEADKNDCMWDVGSFIHDENDNPISPIPMRAVKRRTLLALLQGTKPSCERGYYTYWWIDVLCADASTPLGIMGSIYRYCKHCYAMLDCEPKTLQHLANNDSLKEMSSDYLRLRDEDKDTHATRYNSFVEKWSRQIQGMYQLTQSVWFKRVWTWQEMALPASTFLIPESSGKEINKYTLMMSDFTWTVSWKKLEEPHIIRVLSKDTIQTLRLISNAWSEIREANVYIEENDYFRSMKAHKLVAMIASLGGSTRICMDPVDYVYGVLGILDLNVARMEDHREVWKAFLTKLENRIQWMLENDQDRDWEEKQGVKKSISLSNKAYRVNLSTARNMMDVYGGLLEITYELIDEDKAEDDEEGTTEENEEPRKRRRQNITSMDCL